MEEKKLNEQEIKKDETAAELADGELDEVAGGLIRFDHPQREKAQLRILGQVTDGTEALMKHKTTR